MKSSFWVRTVDLVAHLAAAFGISALLASIPFALLYGATAGAYLLAFVVVVSLFSIILSAWVDGVNSRADKALLRALKSF